jgi:predicted nucleic acid-binding protein
MSAEGRAFVDTNVIAYAYDTASEVKRRAALPLMQELWVSRQGCISIQVLQELFVTLTRKLARPLEVETARGVTRTMSDWTVHAPGVEDIDAAIRLHERHRISFWDAMIVQSAAALGCDTLYSEDLNAGQRYEGVLVVDPFANR